jgi:hypothetical protein
VEKGCKAEEEEPGVASLSASFVINKIELQGVDTYVYYNLSLTETSGDANVILSFRKRCFTSIGCETPVYDPTTKFGTDTVLAGQSVTANNRYFFTGNYPDVMNETWYGTDSNGNAISITYHINVPSSGNAN